MFFFVLFLFFFNHFSLSALRCVLYILLTLLFFSPPLTNPKVNTKLHDTSLLFRVGNSVTDRRFLFYLVFQTTSIPVSNPNTAKLAWASSRNYLQPAESRRPPCEDQRLGLARKASYTHTRFRWTSSLQIAMISPSR